MPGTADFGLYSPLQSLVSKIADGWTDVMCETEFYVVRCSSHSLEVNQIPSN